MIAPDLTHLQSTFARRGERVRELWPLLSEQVRPFIRTENGVTTLELERHAGELRLVLWFCRALFAHGAEDEASAALANGLLESMQVEANAHFNAHFCGVASMLLLLQHADKLSAGAKKNLENYVQTYLSDWMTEDFRIHGANDNAGIECATTVALAGEYFNNPALVAWAKARFERPVRLLEVREYLHECNSPTYSAVSLSTLAELGEAAKDADSRATARALEAQVWREVLTHFHPVLRHHIGPFSRTFLDDSANQCSLVQMALYLALGEVSPFHPRAMLFPPPDGTFAHNSWLFQWLSLAVLSCAPFHPPLELAARCFARQTPFEIAGSNEFSPMGRAPGGQSSVRAHVERPWALSYFGSRPGAGTPMHLTYRRHEVADDAPVEEHLRSLRTITARCTVSDRLANFHLRAVHNFEREFTSEDGAAFCIGQGNALLMGTIPINNRDEIRTVKSSLVFPTRFSRPDEVRFGREPVTGFSATFPCLDWCFIRDGNVFLAIRPLAVQTEGLLFGALQFGAWDGYGTLSVFNRCDFAARIYSDGELRALGGGFVLEVGAVDEDAASFDEWCARFTAARVEDFGWDGQREIRYRRGAVDLELIYDARALSLRRAARGSQLETPGVP